MTSAIIGFTSPRPVLGEPELSFTVKSYGTSGRGVEPLLERRCKSYPQYSVTCLPEMC